MSLLARALVALALTVVFYVFAVAVVVGLVAYPVLVLKAGDSPGAGGFVTVALAITIIVKVVPRRDPFVAPGPRVTPEEQPELTRLVDEVAQAVGLSTPDATYLVADVNAGVFETRSLSRRRVLVLGMPLLEVVSADELRAILAHEFGHYVAGDARFSRWTYRTRESVLRVSAMQWSEKYQPWIVAWVRWPFRMYARLFLRVTSAITRRQELAADALAARVAGTAAQVGALRRTAACGPAFDGYWSNEVVPALANGLRPPIGAGFREFLSVERIDAAVRRELDTALERDEHDPYDSHPTLRQRLAALGAGPDDDRAVEGPPASTLLRDHAGLEAGVVRALAGDLVDTMPEATWSDVEQDWLRRYAVMVDARRSALARWSVGDVPALALHPDELALTLRATWPDAFAEHSKPLARELLAAALFVALVRDGFEFDAGPGRPITCVRADARFVPFVDVAAIADGSATVENLRDRLVAAGVEGAPLVEGPEPDLGAPAPERELAHVPERRREPYVPAKAAAAAVGRGVQATARAGFGVYRVIGYLMLGFLVLCGPGMMVGFALAGRLGEVVGALFLPAVAAVGGVWLLRRRGRDAAL
jgi:heat shock protein HtpX